MTVILRLTNSDDFNERVPEGERAQAVAERVFAAETGVAATTVSKVMWPTPAFPTHLDRWLDESKPDLVMLRIAAYWVTFRSVPLRLKRRTGRVGKALSDIGTASARVRWLAETPPYHGIRRALLRPIGGDANFTVDEVVSVVEASARRVLARGYAIVDDGRGDLVATAERAREVRDVRVTFADASVAARIEDE